MPLAVLADAEFIVTTYLRNHASITPLVGLHVPDVGPSIPAVHTELPETPTYPLLWLKMVTGTVVVPRRLAGPVFDIDAMAATKTAARLLAATAHAALWDASNATNNGGAITGVDDVLGPYWAPDPLLKKPAYRFSIRVYIHPVP